MPWLATTTLSKPILFVRKTHGLRFGVDVQFVVNIGNVFSDRKCADVDDGRNPFGVPTMDHVFKDFFFSFGDCIWNARCVWSS